ncbi:hypothetical protein PFICI_04706 [Pestalotiopsis fici W106-1]|uniref:Uncharacterized protein n=1 Tax=Pestalotiopsis fici (strain W106-1 / CGMCC3.15140) TaxID=1229662 RepID=W3X9U8_PESFW|nr:uncharacterized protein PFICI_04706 [Pestalotiopsis fici W106-1]ETS82830.1 hypothetical protein PFICI_04706 [Pestalotiopsis fici W106-1]
MKNVSQKKSFVSRSIDSKVVVAIYIAAVYALIDNLGRCWLLIKTSLPTPVEIREDKAPDIMKPARQKQANKAVANNFHPWLVRRFFQKSLKSNSTSPSGAEELRRIACRWWYSTSWRSVVEKDLCKAKQMILQKREPTKATKNAVKAMSKSASCRFNVRVAPMMRPRDQFVHVPMYAG